jgi:hypothetical protein
MIIDETTLTQFFSALTVLILAIIAWYNKTRTDSAAITAAATTQTAVTNQAMAAVTPGIASPTTTPTAPASMVSQPAGYGVPLYSTAYKMRQTTRDFLNSSITDPADWANVLRQIAAAELQNLSDYIVSWSHGRWAHIHFGTWMATNGQKTFISQVIGGAFDDSQGITPPTK